jgi:hypothetical protein
MSGPLGRIIIATKKAPAAIGPYNQAVQVGNVQWWAKLKLLRLQSYIISYRTVAQDRLVF